VADAAKQAREQECGKVGDKCRRRQDAEAAALAALTKAQENKAATERFDQIETELKRLRSQKGETTVATIDPVLGHVARPVTHAASPTIDAVPAPTKAVEAPAIEVPVSLLPKPRLVAQEKARTKGVALYLAERLQPKPGARVELEECQFDYAASGLRPLTTKEFVESLQHFCSACRIKTRVIGDKVYLLDVQLAPMRGREAS